MSGDIGGSQVSGFVFNMRCYILGVQKKASLVIPPILRVTRRNPTPARTSKPPPNRHVSPENRGHFPPHLPQLLSPEILVPYFERVQILGCIPHIWGAGEKRRPSRIAGLLPLSWLKDWEVPWGGGPPQESSGGVPPLPVRTGDTPPKSVPAHPSPTRRERQLHCPSQIPPTLHSSPYLEGSRGPQKIPKKSRMLGRRS